jgi:hypothetical protein
MENESTAHKEQTEKPVHDYKTYVSNAWNKYRKKSWWAIPLAVLIAPNGIGWGLFIGASALITTQVNNYISKNNYLLEGKVIEMRINEDYEGLMKIAYTDEKNTMKKRNFHLLPQDTTKTAQPYKSLEQDILRTFEEIQPGDSVRINAYKGLVKKYATNVQEK